MRSQPKTLGHLELEEAWLGGARAGPMDLSRITQKLEVLDEYKMKDSTMRCVKYLLFMLNLIISVLGSILIIAGVVLQVTMRQYLDFLDHPLVSVAGLLLVLGLVTASISACGCCGALHEHHGLTSTYSWVLGTIVLVELGLGLMLYTASSQVGTFLEESMEAGMSNFKREGYRGVTETWNVLQHELSCCGTQSYHDWVNTTFSVSNTFSVPDSCCITDIVGCGRGILSITDPHEVNLKVHREGCMAVISHHLADNVTTLVALVVATLFVQLVGLVFSFCLANSIKKECEIV